MSIFEHEYPYTDYHNFNLDWIIKEIKNVRNEWDEYQVINHITMGGNWDITQQYTKWTIVESGIDAYISLQPVPSGIDITNTSYWRILGLYGSVIHELQVAIEQLQLDIDSLDTRIDNLASDIALEITRLEGEIARVEGEIPEVIDNLTSTDTDKSLSANMGKELETQILNLQNIGRFLAVWDATTGEPTSEPPTLPYEYHTGDYYRIGTVGQRVPKGSEYIEGEYDTVTYYTAIGDVFYYDGTVWRRQTTSGGGTVQDVQKNGVSVLSGGIANVTVPDVVDNVASTSTTDALSAKQGKTLKELIDSVDNKLVYSTTEHIIGKLGNKNLYLKKIELGETTTGSALTLTFSHNINNLDEVYDCWFMWKLKASGIWYRQWDKAIVKNLTISPTTVTQDIIQTSATVWSEVNFYIAYTKNE